jgi:hypothetical protein
MAFYNNFSVTAFDDGTIHKSCGEQLNLRSDKVVYYGGILVYAIYTQANDVCVSFVGNHGCYCDPKAEDFTGAHGGEHHC